MKPNLKAKHNKLSLFSKSLLPRIRLKTRALIAVILLVVLPAGTMLIAAEYTKHSSLAMLLCLHFSLCVAMCVPLSGWLEELLINSELRRMNSFCVKLKQGKLDQRLELQQHRIGNTTDEMLLLQHNLNWLAHSVAKREHRLTQSLLKTRRDKERLNLLSYTDHLTGLFNKRFFELKLIETCARCISCNTQLHLMLIDCDHFKEVNDKYGHQEGDRLLANLGQIIELSVRNGTDFPFRFGGDEFGAILVGVDSTRCEQIAERIRIKFADMKIGKSSLSIGISQLCCHANDPETEADSLFATADKALYFAKNTGRDKIISLTRYNEISHHN
ncbi:GGDEF domain-containing protein [Maridesulfovibrio sp.]|uniref:GGDEF domain-containing protein n=1 Tax=Maridesulfovibrio sp. TaxID=2795000 RepID=UPI0029F495B2|nr:GGDEF domain-containing protein [Maridesulfovibrio sp.]